MTPTRSADESGFTLTELLVAMSAAVVVLFALTTIMIGVMRGTQRTFTRLDATERARNAISDLENELHSACIGGLQAPIQAGSTSTKLQFLSYYGAQASPTPVWHTVSYQQTPGKTTGTLVDTSGVATGAAPNWAAPTQSSSVQLLTNVTQPSSGSVFQYYAYKPSNGSDAGGTYWFVPDGTTPDPVTTQLTNTPLPVSSTTPLSATDAADTVEVMVNLSVGSSSSSLNNQSLTAVNDQIDDAISLRLTTPPDEVPSTTSVTGAIPPGYGPCE